MVSRVREWFKKNWSHTPVVKETWSEKDEKWWACKNKRKCPWPNYCDVGDCKWEEDFDGSGMPAMR